MINPSKIKDSSFITDFIKTKIDDKIWEGVIHVKHNVGIQTDIKGRIYDDIDDKLLDEIIDMNIQNININTSNYYLKNTENSDYDLINSLTFSNSQNLGQIKRKSENLLFNNNNIPINNKTFGKYIGPLSQRASILDK